MKGYSKSEQGLVVTLVERHNVVQELDQTSPLFEGQVDTVVDLDRVDRGSPIFEVIAEQQAAHIENYIIKSGNNRTFEEDTLDPGYDVSLVPVSVGAVDFAKATSEIGDKIDYVEMFDVANSPNGELFLLSDYEDQLNHPKKIWLLGDVFKTGSTIAEAIRLVKTYRASVIWDYSPVSEHRRCLLNQQSGLIVSAMIHREVPLSAPTYASDRCVDLAIDR